MESQEREPNLPHEKYGRCSRCGEKTPYPQMVCHDGYWESLCDPCGYPPEDGRA